MQIVSIVKDSFIECAPFNWGLTLFCFGCNLRCKVCEGYNYETIKDKRNIIGNAIDTLERELKPCHDCVTFIGGEPTIWGDKLIEALRYCHNRGVKTKIFTNGMLPEVVKHINSEKLCDAWSVDYKGLPSNIAEFIGTTPTKYNTNLEKTLDNIVLNKLPLEIRTTFYEDNEADKEAIKEICEKYITWAKEVNGNDYFCKWIEQHDVRAYLPH